MPSPTTAVAAGSPPPRPPAAEARSITIVSHSNLFYWWPVWAVGFLMAFVTLITQTRAVVVPGEALKAPAGQMVTVQVDPGKSLHVSSSKNLGVLFAMVLLLVIAITNIPLRGLWSVIVIVFVIFLSIILALLNAWETILDYLSLLDVRINLGGYLLISSVLFVLWLVVFLFFDKQIYMIFTPGQMRVRLEIGDAETAYDTSGMTVQKQRSDLFRHWVLGLGSGDLIVKTSGAQAHHFDMPNVLFVSPKIRQIERLLAEKATVSAQ
ncbi:MAG TPA: hypothetical protein VHR72_08865 [Gemmataceae bacterium]|jgi:hypothetical protein|nr:hypothetical protein [Gemmataceae bacterium]